MTNTTSLKPAGGRSSRAAEREANRRSSVRRRRLLRGTAVAVIVSATVLIGFFVTRGDDPRATASPSVPIVGGDLHTATSIKDALFVGGHAAVAVSHDQGHTWKEVASLAGADAMGWAVTPEAVLVGGHPGLFKSTDGGDTFAPVDDVSFNDVHALGGAGPRVYLASPAAGLLVSTDGGTHWKVRNSDAGRSFMGTILVDPKDPQRLIAPDMSGALAVSRDGGLHWEALGGPMGAMAADWNPTNTDEVVAVGMDGAARSVDGGAKWQTLDVPMGTSAIAYARDGKVLIAAALEGERAVTYRSTDDGATWTRST